MTTRTYATRTAAVQAIEEILGEYAPEHDIDAIAEKVIDTTPGTWRLQYTITEDTELFWDTVARHSI